MFDFFPINSHVFSPFVHLCSFIFSFSHFLILEREKVGFSSGHDVSIGQCSGVSSSRLYALVEYSPCNSLSYVFFRKKNGFVNVFSEYDVLSQFLTDPRFRIVNCQADADILWYRRHFNDFL